MRDSPPHARGRPAVHGPAHSMRSPALKNTSSLRDRLAREWLLDFLRSVSEARAQGWEATAADFRRQAEAATDYDAWCRLSQTAYACTAAADVQRRFGLSELLHDLIADGDLDHLDLERPAA